jgi:hypothetical protein
MISPWYPHDPLVLKQRLPENPPFIDDLLSYKPSLGLGIYPYPPRLMTGGNTEIWNSHFFSALLLVKLVKSCQVFTMVIPIRCPLIVHHGYSHLIRNGAPKRVGYPNDNCSHTAVLRGAFALGVQPRPWEFTHTVDGCEILQLVDGFSHDNPIIYSVS